MFAVSANAAVTLSAEAVGSAIVVLVFDPVASIAGMLQAMLPSARLDARRAALDPGMFVDSGIVALLEAIHAAGAVRERCRVHLIGAAEPRLITAGKPGLTVGKRNIDAACAKLKEHGMSIEGRHTGHGEIHGVRFVIGTGAITILKSFGRKELV